jgi:Ca2+-transporting ATPase
MIFMSLTLMQLGNAVALRSESRSAFRVGLRRNMFLVVTFLVTLGLQFLALYWSPLQELLDLEGLGVGDLAIVLMASTLGFWALELKKVWSRHRAWWRDRDSHRDLNCASIAD